MAAPTLETNAAADTLRILDGTSGDPVTWNDVWDWDDGGGSSGGAGDVPKDGGGTARVDTFVTEIVADKVYLVLKDVDFGDNVVPTYFKSPQEMVDMSGFQPRIRSSATLVIGEASNDYSKKGSFWRFSGKGWEYYMMANGETPTFNVYGSILEILEDSLFLNGGTVEIKNSNVFMSYTNRYFIIDRYTISVTLDGFYIADNASNSNRLGLRSTGTVFYNNIHSEDLYYGFYSKYVDTIVTGGKATNCTYDIDLDDAQTFYYDDPIIPTSQAKVKCDDVDGIIYQRYSCNVHIADKDGADLVGVTVDCEDTTGTAVWAAGTITTDASGDITEQLIVDKKWAGTSETETAYSPYKFTIYLAGYETLVLDAVTVDEPILWKLELQTLRGRAYGRSHRIDVKQYV